MLFFRQSLFFYIVDKLEETLVFEKKEDANFIENSIINLDDKLKKNYPLKGQIEVELYQKRSAQITEHKNRYDRHARVIIDKNIQQTQEFNFMVEDAMGLISRYVDEMNGLTQSLLTQTHLSKLQGILNQAREKFHQFNLQSAELINQLQTLAIEQPNQLEKSNKTFIKSLQENSEYSKEECDWYEDMINEINKEISSQQTVKQKRFEVSL